MQHTNKCPVSTTMDMIGGKYKGLILWNLSNNTLRFSQLNRLIPDATAKMLTQQLRELEAHGLVRREVFPVIPPKVEYSLTPLGASLLPVLTALRDWGAQYLRSMDLESDCIMMQTDYSQHKNERT